MNRESYLSLAQAIIECNGDVTPANQGDTCPKGNLVAFDRGQRRTVAIPVAVAVSPRDC